MDLAKSANLNLELCKYTSPEAREVETKRAAMDVVAGIDFERAATGVKAIDVTFLDGKVYDLWITYLRGEKLAALTATMRDIFG